jgi:hypothetical protein
MFSAYYFNTSFEKRLSLLLMIGKVGVKLCISSSEKCLVALFLALL